MNPYSLAATLDQSVLALAALLAPSCLLSGFRRSEQDASSALGAAFKESEGLGAKPVRRKLEREGNISQDGLSCLPRPEDHI